MKFTTSLLALVASVMATPHAVTEDIRPKGQAPKSCQASIDGEFEVTILRPSSPQKRHVIEKRCSGEGVLTMTLKDGVLKDAKDRTGYISSSYQFQFDGPPQAGAIFTAGFSACSNGSLALGSSTVFYQCLSGDFYNLYDRHWAEQCKPIEIIMNSCGGGVDKNKVAPERKVVGSSIVATTVVTVMSDGKPQVMPTTIVVPMCQIGDGQVQVRTTPCDDMKFPVATVAPVAQVSDGKIELPTAKPQIQVIESKLPSEILNTQAVSAQKLPTQKLSTQTLSSKGQVQTKEPVLQTATGKPSIPIVTTATTAAKEDASHIAEPFATASAIISSSDKLIPCLAAVFVGLFGVALCL